MRTKTALALALLLPAAEPLAAESVNPPFAVDARVTALGGASSGLATRRDSGGLGVVRASVVPLAAQGPLELRVPLRLERDQAFGSDLTSTTAGAALEPQWQAMTSVRLGAELGYLRVWRLGWPDQYQPNPDLTLRETDRYSYRALRGGANVYARPAPHQHLRLRWRATSYDYRRDPNFDELDPTPTHLTPRDNVQNELDASWRYVEPAWALALRLGTDFRRDSVYPARQAQTGSPVAGTRQKLNDYEPRAEIELRKLPGRVKLSLELGWAIRDDLYAGYYSYSGPHPRAVAEWAATDRLSLVADVQAWWLTYGPSSKANTEDGKRLYDHRGLVRGEARYALGRGLSFLGEASWRSRTTNYPDYVPGVFPASQLYDIRWDYDNYRVLAGVEWRG